VSENRKRTERKYCVGVWVVQPVKSSVAVVEVEKVLDIIESIEEPDYGISENDIGGNNVVITVAVAIEGIVDEAIDISISVLPVVNKGQQQSASKIEVSGHLRYRLESTRSQHLVGGDKLETMLFFASAMAKSSGTVTKFYLVEAVLNRGSGKTNIRDSNGERN
jgi:hypothetical protein